MADSPEQFIQTTCPKCDSQWRAPTTSVGRRLPCPKCGHEFEIVAPAKSSPLRESQTYIAPPSDDDEYAIREMPLADGHSGPVVPVTDLPENYSDELRSDEYSSKIEKEVMAGTERAKLPRRPMIDGVLSFFWNTSAVICWSASSLGATLVCWFLWRALAVGGFGVLATAAPGSGLQAAASAMTSLILSLIGGALGAIWLIVVSGCFLAILHDSAAGNRIIHNWPELNVIEWLGSAIYLVMSLVIPVGLVHVLTWPLGGLAVCWWLVPISVWLVFPVILLSALEVAAPLLPFSPIVWRSLVKCRRTWGIFYLETGLLAIGIVLLAAGLAFLDSKGFMGAREISAALLAGTGVAAAMLYFRLLGRVAWVCDEYFRLHPIEKPEKPEKPEKHDKAEKEVDETPEIRPTPVDDF